MGRKGKAVPASSAKALEVCGDTSLLGVSAADVFAQFGTPLQETYVEDTGAVPVLDDAELSVALHALQKKDPTTRLRGVGELRNLFAVRSGANLKEVCAPFLHIYRRLWPQDAEPRVREGLQRCMQVLVEATQRDFAKHLKSAFPAWLCAMFDTHAEVAQAARAAFKSSFPSDEKRRGVFRHCHKECLALLLSNLRHSEQSLHEELGILGPAPQGDRNAALERTDRYGRVIAASLGALGELIHVCGNPASPSPTSSPTEGSPQAPTPLGADALVPFFQQGSPCALWPRLASKQPPLVRRAAAECLVRLLRSPAVKALPGEEVEDIGPLLSANHNARSAVVNTLTDDAIMPSTALTLVCSFALAAGPACWEGLNASKSLWPQLHTAISRAAARDAAFLEQLPVLFEVLPAAAWTPGRGESLLSALLAALPQALLGRAPAAEIWRAYFTVVMTADSSSVPVASVWRWLPVEYCLGSEPLAEQRDTGDEEEAEKRRVDLPPPVSSVPQHLLAALPSVLASELPSMTQTRPEAAAELLAVLKRTAPLGVGKSSLIQTAWTNWLGLLRPLQEAAGETGLAAAALLAEQVQLLIVAAASASPSEGLHAAEPLLKVLGRLLSADGQVPSCGWAPPTSAFPSWSTSQEIPEEWPAEAALFVWPVLPWTLRWIKEGSIDGVRALGTFLVKPMLEMGLRRPNFPVKEVRDRALDVLMGDLSTSELGPALLLVLDYFPSELEASHSPICQATVRKLAASVSAAADPADLKSSLAALKVGLKPGGLPHSVVAECLVLMEAGSRSATSRQEKLRLAALAATTLEQYLRRQAPEGDLAAAQPMVCQALLRALLQGEEEDQEEEEDEAQGWLLLPRLLRGGDVLTVVPETLGPAPFGASQRSRWARALTAAASVSGIAVVELLSSCGGAKTKQQRTQGALDPQQLLQSALATSELMGSVGPAALLGNASPSAAAEEETLRLLWEMLLADAVLPGHISEAAAGSTWAWLSREVGQATRWRFVRLCAEQAVEEGAEWHVEAEEGTALTGWPVGAQLHGLSVLRQALRQVWPSSQVEAPGDLMRDLLSWALEAAPERPSTALGWGHAVASIVRCCSEFSLCSPPDLASNGPRSRWARTAWRDRLQKAVASQALRPQLLYAAAAVELWAGGEEPSQARSSRAEVSDEEDAPLIMEMPAGATKVAPEEVEAEELDTSLVELQDKLLRWAQSGKDTASAADSLAEFAAATWSLPGLAKDRSLAAVGRMQRLTLELLGSGPGPPGSQRQRISPGALRLVAALSKAGAWSESNWQAVIHAATAVDSIALAEEGAGTRSIAAAFAEDALTAASAVLHYAPAAAAGRLVPLLAAADPRLRAAAAARLQRHSWVPLQGSSADPRSPCSVVLKQLEAVLREADAEAEELEVPHSLASSVGALLGFAPSARMDKTPSPADVTHGGLVAVLGPELTKQLWSVDAALTSFLEWEAETDSEPEGSSEEGEASCSSGGHGVSDVPGPQLGRIGGEIPAECQRLCAGALAAWELLLLALVQEPPATAAPSGDQGKLPMPPTELLASALQLSSDLVVGSKAAKAFQADVAPAQDLLSPLLQLLFHVLTSGRLLAASEADPSEVVRRALSTGGEVTRGHFDIFPMAARVLLLALRALPAAVRSFWEKLPRKHDRDLVERLVKKSFSPSLIQAEASAASAQLEAQSENLPDIEATVARRQRQLLLNLVRDDLRAELCVQLPDSFPLRLATAELPEKMPGIPKKRIQNWMLQARKVMGEPKPASVGRVMYMWARSFALFFEGVEDCPICYNVIHLSTQTIPRKACPTCKHKFHNECLYHWFKTSSKTTCPLCNQPIQ